MLKLIYGIAEGLILYRIKNGFRLKVRLKYEAEKYIYTKNNKLDKFKKKWALHLRSFI